MRRACIQFSNLRFATERSPVLASRGMVASTQPLASEAGLRILRQGGNAADAAVAMAAALNVTQPWSTGIGGDACALYYNSSSRKVESLSGFGRSGAAFTRERVIADGFQNCAIPAEHGLAVMVPGAVQLFDDVLTHWGQLSFKEVLAPAIELCEHGFPVAPMSASGWKKDFHRLKGEGCSCYKTSSGEPPFPGKRMKNLDLGHTFRRISEMGARKGFYEGEIAEAIVAAVKQFGGVLTLDDLKAIESAQPVTPTHTAYRGYRVWEVPPPSQGIVVLAALNHLEELLPNASSATWGSDHVLHAQIEALRLAFFDALQFNADPTTTEVPIESLVNKEEAAKLRVTHRLSRQASSLKRRANAGDEDSIKDSNTVYFCAVDADGNACSFINSIFEAFGTGIVPAGCGFALNNRGCCFCMSDAHPNSIGPSKRPYNTIIPGMCTDDEGQLFCAFGVMGGFMQPQGQLQVLTDLIDFKMDPQAALDAPRFCITGIHSSLGPKTVEESRVSIENGFDNEAIEKLKERGHRVTQDLSCFYGHGQIILRRSEGVLWGGTDPRGDGVVMGF